MTITNIIINVFKKVSVLESTRFTKQEYDTRMIYGVLDNNTILHIGESLARHPHSYHLGTSISKDPFCSGELIECHD